MKSFLTLLLFAVVAFLAASCGVDSIQQPAASSGPDFIQLLDSPTTAVTLDDDDDDDDDDDGDDRDDDADDDEGSWNQQQTSASAWVTRWTGGTVSVGRYTVTVPPQAIPGWYERITVEIREENGTVACELSPHGLQFQVPVTLTMDLSGADVDERDQITIFWYDEATDDWVDMGGTFDPNAPEVSAELPHFSRYGAGRAGW